MLRITIPATEMWDERKQEFVSTKEQKLQLEHSLVSLSIWESKWHKPFLSTKEKTYEEIQTELLTLNTKAIDIVLKNGNNEKWHKQYFEILYRYLEKRVNTQKQTVDLIEYTIQGLK